MKGILQSETLPSEYTRWEITHQKEWPMASQKRKVFILDTCVLRHDPHCIDKFADNIVVIPIWAVEELDDLKKKMDQVGEDAREISRILDEYRKQGSLAKGVPTKGGGLVIVDHNGNDFSMLPIGLEKTRDNRILLVGQAWYDSMPKRPQHKRPGSKKRLNLPEVPPFFEVQLITKDTNLRLKADACSIPTDDYLNDKLVRNLGELYTGIGHYALSENMSELLDGRNQIWKDYRIPAGMLADELDLGALLHNQCCELAIYDKTISTIYRKDKGYFTVVDKQSLADDEVRPRNTEQWLAYYLAMDPNLDLVTLGGHAGTGKTLMALLAGYRQFKAGLYDQLLVYRPNIPMGEDLGCLPGDIEEKFAPWMMPIRDNMRLILGDEMDTGKPQEVRGRIDPMTEMIRAGTLEISPTIYVRGRSVRRSFMVVDEAQNLTPHQAKTVASRAGEGTKVIFTGDVEQIDNPKVDSISNGFVYTAESLKDTSYIGHIALVKSERSRLAELVATRM